MIKNQKIANWGNFPKIDSTILETSNKDEIINFIKNNNSLIPRGNGRSYGDASLANHTFSSLQLNEIYSFDEERGILECGSGTLLEKIIEITIPKGYFLKVSPGTKFVTIGGAIAANVHGKNHHIEGSFINSVISLKVINEFGKEIECSKESNSELFYLTIGGMGTTGIITSAKISLKPIETKYINYEYHISKNLSETINLFEQNKHKEYSVAWIDCLSGGNGVLITGEHVRVKDLPNSKRKKALDYTRKKKNNLPKLIPSFLLSNFTIKLFNILYFNKKRISKNKGRIGLDQFFYPLDSLNEWNSIYGKKGFIQYQFVIPKPTMKEGLEEVFELLNKEKKQPFLTVLKVFDKEDLKCNHSFPMEGATLAMDFKYTSSIPNLVVKLDSIIKKYNGRVYLAKDALSQKDVAILPKRYNDKFISLQTQRLK